MSCETSSLISDANTRHHEQRWWVLLFLVLCLGGVYAGMYLKRGWVPHDEGAFAESAERVLHGELPHRDYTEIYTGGLAQLHAMAFQYLGENLATLRIVLFGFFLLWIPVFYWAASRLVADWIASGMTLLAIAWSLPNYSAAVPSWYNLFFATFGMAALLAFLSDGSRKWLFLAGLCGGFSILAKAPGFYYVGGVLLFFLFLEQDESSAKDKAAKSRSYVYSAFLIVVIFLFLAGLALMIREHGNPEEIVNFVLPPSILATIVLLRELGSTGRTNGERFLALARTTLPFALGLLVPIAGFVVPYLYGNGLGALLKGVFVLPSKRIWGAFMNPPPLFTIFPLLLLIGILALVVWLRGRARWLLILTLGLAVIYGLYSSAYSRTTYQRMWDTAYWMNPVLVVMGTFVIRREAADKAASEQRLEKRQLFLVLAIGSLCALVQYPFSAPIYFCYVAPLFILAGMAVLRAFPSIPRPLLAVVFSGFFFFAVLRVTPQFIYAMGYHYQPNPETQILDLPRSGNLRVEPDAAKMYEQLIPLIREHAGAGEIYAAPDCPQIYFLAGYHNPTRAAFDLFEKDYLDNGRILRLVDSQPIRVIVINKMPAFSSRLPPEVYKGLVARYPEGKEIGTFEVRWRK